MEKIKSLNIWKNDLTINPLEGGITNLNFLVNVANNDVIKEAIFQRVWAYLHYYLEENYGFPETGFPKDEIKEIVTEMIQRNQATFINEKNRAVCKFIQTLVDMPVEEREKYEPNFDEISRQSGILIRNASTSAWEYINSIYQFNKTENSDISSEELWNNLFNSPGIRNICGDVQSVRRALSFDSPEPFEDNDDSISMEEDTLEYTGIGNLNQYVICNAIGQLQNMNDEDVLDFLITLERISPWGATPKIDKYLNKIPTTELTEKEIHAVDTLANVAEAALDKFTDDIEETLDQLLKSFSKSWYKDNPTKLF